MLHIEDQNIQKLLLKGNVGLEKESLRVDEEGFMAHTKDPFSGNKHITRDFSENQTEINTPAMKSPEEAVEALMEYYREIQKVLSELPEREYLWPFSNPPKIRNEEDIPIAQFEGDLASKTEYREYLSDRYGRYKMTFSGIHFNYSFDDELLKTDFALSGQTDFTEYKNELYVTLAERVAAYGWLITAITAASPLMDESFVEKKIYNKDNFNGMASVRCSELGYWNMFAPIFDYSNVRNYADSIQKYVDDGLIRYASELYYPIRLKPPGENNLKRLRENGVDHIELRMFDLNPLLETGIDIRDVKFAQYFLIWLAGTERQPFSNKDQVQAVQNFKNAAHFDLKTVKIVVPNGEVYSVADAALNVIGFMKEFYNSFEAEYSEEVKEILAFEEAKFLDHTNRYAWLVKDIYSDSFAEKGLELARVRQEQAIR